MSNVDVTKDVVEEGEIVPQEDQGQENQGQENEDFHPLWSFTFPEGPLTLACLDALAEAIENDPYDSEAASSLCKEATRRFIEGIAAGVYTPEMILQLSLKFRNANLC